LCNTLHRAFWMSQEVRRSVDFQKSTSTQAAFHLLRTVVFQGNDHFVPSVAEGRYSSHAFRCTGETAEAASTTAGQSSQRRTIVGGSRTTLGCGDLHRRANIEQ